jgi:hypothetical protein
VTWFHGETREVRLSFALKQIRKNSGETCAHLFDPAFAREIGPLLELPPTVEALASAVRSLYIGRRVLGLERGMANQIYDDSAHVREFQRIQTLLAGKPTRYHEPLF